MHRKFVLAVFVSLILTSFFTYAFGQSNLSGSLDRQCIAVAQNSSGESSENDRAFWDSVKDSRNPDEFKAYLEQFPEGVFAPLARTRLKVLENGGTQSQSGTKTASSQASLEKEIARDGRFIAYSNGTVLDTTTNLMWAAKDNGYRISWKEAQDYCYDYRGGNYTDWRMPTQDEVAELYDAAKTYKSTCYGVFGGSWDIHLTNLINLSCHFVWASNHRYFDISSGKYSGDTMDTAFDRALPVRSVK